MDNPVMFNGRLSKNELDIWLNLLNRTSESSYKDRDLAKAFLMLEESITFVSSLESETIGGTSIYKDKTRLSMVLTSIAVSKEFRESATFQIVKSAMPFFKTVAIRDVDALLSIDGSKNTLGFPLSLELDPWVTDVIKRAGFEEVDSLEHCSFVINEEIKKNPLIWNSKVNSEQVRELIWDQSKPMGLTNSLVWLARDFAVNRNCLVTVDVDDEAAAVAGFWKVSDTLCVSPFIANPEKLNWDLVAESLVASAVERDARHIELPILGEGQRNLIGALENWCSHSSCRKLLLLRKPL